jgi:cell wall-associated NlpC family hydrolase
MRPLLLCLLVTAGIACPFANAAPAPDAYMGGSQARKAVVSFARKQVGIPYRLGGRTRHTGYDCSGLVSAAYRSIGRTIPHTTWMQLLIGRHIASGQLRPGDLVFSEGGAHVGLVVSRKQAITAPRPGARMHYVSLSYFRSNFAGARRLLN